MQNIHRVEFPLALAFGARGGPERFTEISTSVSGFEQRNTPLSQSRRHYDVGAGIKSLSDMQILIDFFEARMGQLYGFLFLDPVDHQTCKYGQVPAATDQLIGTGDGETTEFALVKTYGDEENDYKRRIYYPILDSLQVAVDGQLQAFSFDEQRGRLRLVEPPLDGALISAGFSFHTPVRFDSSRLDISLEAVGAGQAAHISLVELLLTEDDNV